MGKKDETFEHESLQDQDSLINYLKAISDGFKKGRIQFSDEDDDMTLTPEKMANLRIRAVKSKKSQELRIKISWSSDQDTDFDDTPLFIDAKKRKK